MPNDKAEFPIEVNFVRDPMVIRFSSADGLAKWVSTERAFWSAFAAGQQDQYSAILHGNMRLLDRATSPDQLQEISMQYVPSESGIGRVLTRIANPLVARVAFGTFVKPDAVQWQNDNIQVEGRIIGSAYRALGDPLGSREKLEQALGEVGNLRSTEQTILDRWSTHLAKAEDEWRAKIEGYETRVALGAPRQYWEARAKKARRSICGRQTDMESWSDLHSGGEYLWSASPLYANRVTRIAAALIVVWGRGIAIAARSRRVCTASRLLKTCCLLRNCSRNGHLVAQTDIAGFALARALVRRRRRASDDD